jgi:hypothetical protein
MARKVSAIIVEWMVLSAEGCDWGSEREQVPCMEQKFYMFWKGLFTRGGKEKEVVQTYCTDGAARLLDRSSPSLNS